MSAGELNDTVTFLRPTETLDDLRGAAVDYTEKLVTVPGHFKTMTSRDLLLAQAMQVLPTAMLVVRYRADLTTTLRVRDERTQKVYAIASVTDTAGARIWLDLFLAEVL